MYRFFSNNDFYNASPSCSIQDMSASFLSRLDQAREYAGVPFVVNSGFRTLEHEKKQGRDGSSSHTKGIAVDIQAMTLRDRYLILQGLLKAGFTRIGVGETFIHVDGDPDKDQDAIWHYY